MPSVPAVTRNIAGSISGDASQNAITADSGAPTASRAAMNGITSQEQNGASPPTSAPMAIMCNSDPVNALLNSASAPVAFSQATASTAAPMNIAVCNIDSPANRRAGNTCPGSRIASSGGISAIASHALSIRRHSRRSDCEGRAAEVAQQPGPALTSGSTVTGCVA